MLGIDAKNIHLSNGELEVHKSLNFLKEPPVSPSIESAPMRPLPLEHALISTPPAFDPKLAKSKGSLLFIKPPSVPTTGDLTGVPTNLDSPTAPTPSFSAPSAAPSVRPSGAPSASPSEGRSGEAIEHHIRRLQDAPSRKPTRTKILKPSTPPPIVRPGMSIFV